MTPKYSAFDIAKYFLLRAQNEGQELLSNLKLQKLVYYAQGLYLAMNDKPLFKDKIEAWNYGPVVPNLYHHYKECGASGIPADPDFSPAEVIGKKIIDFLDEIYGCFGQFSAIRLMEIAHSDKCWKEAGIGNEISLDSMKKCLKKYLKHG